MECTFSSSSPTRAGGRRARLRRERGALSPVPVQGRVLATGGIGRAYSTPAYLGEYTGDGQALAYQAGAALQDMEFVQFHPTGLIWPPSVRGIR